jgi:hypothetical protein
MEVASPLAFVPAGTKRTLSCSPQQLLESTNHANQTDEDLFQRSHKRRRFHADTSVESLSNAFAAPSTFFNNPPQGSAGPGAPFGRFPLTLVLDPEYRCRVGVLVLSVL